MGPKKRRTGFTGATDRRQGSIPKMARKQQYMSQSKNSTNESSFFQVNAVGKNNLCKTQPIEGVTCMTSGSGLKSESNACHDTDLKANEKKDEKTKAINKMLKNLDIKISGFDNILPKEERIINESHLKSSISENVKTKSRAAAVKVIASLNPHKPNAATVLKRLQKEENSKKISKLEEKANDKEKAKQNEITTVPKNKESWTTKTKNLLEQKNNDEVVTAIRNSGSRKSVGTDIINDVKSMIDIKRIPVQSLVSKDSAQAKSKKIVKAKTQTDGEQYAVSSKIQLGEIENIESIPVVEIVTGKKKYLKSKQKKKINEIEVQNECINLEDAPNKPEPTIKHDTVVEKNWTAQKVSEIIESKPFAVTAENVEIPMVSADSKTVLSAQYTSDTFLNCQNTDNLKIPPDSNTELVQMDIEEISIKSGGTLEILNIKDLHRADVNANENQKQNKKEVIYNDTDENVVEMHEDSEKDVRNITDRSSIRHGGSAYYKSVHNAHDNVTTKIDKTKIKNKNVKTNDIYDFKSGSEEELNIKMELPTLKNILEFSEDNNNPKTDNSKGSVENCFSNTLISPNKLSFVAPTKSDLKIVSKCHGENLHTRSGYTKIMQAPSKNSATKKVAYKKKKHCLELSRKQQSKFKYPKKTSEKKIPVESYFTAESSDSEDAKKLITFGKKRHRMASLNALAKVQCLYENESRTAYELGLSKATQLPPKMRTLDGSDDEKDIKEMKGRGNEEKSIDVLCAIKKEYKKASENGLKLEKTVHDDLTILGLVQKSKSKQEVEIVEDIENKRELRNVPGGRGLGKHWEFCSDSENEEIEKLKLKKKKMQKKLQTKKDKKIEKANDKEKYKKKEFNKRIDPDKSKEKPMRRDKNKMDKLDTAEKPEKVKRKYTKVTKPNKKTIKHKFIVSSNDEASSSEFSNNEPIANNIKSDMEKQTQLKLNSIISLDTKKPAKKRSPVLLRDKRDLLIGDYKGILARKRMASLNASAIVAATYEVERHLDKNLSYEYSSYDSSEDDEHALKGSTSKQVKNPKRTESDIQEEPKEPVKQTQIHKVNSKKSYFSNATISNLNDESNDSKLSKETNDSNNTDCNTATKPVVRDCSTAVALGNIMASNKDVLIRPKSSSVVIVQDTDVTITGVYVNAKSGSSQEGYCKMQYRVQSSVTEEHLLRPNSVETPPKSYTPLNALSSMLPPLGTTTSCPGGILNDVHCPPSPAPPPLVIGNSALTDALTVNSISHTDLGIHTEHGASDPPPTPSYANVAAFHPIPGSAAANIHTHHHQIPKQYGHHYQIQPAQCSSEHTIHSPLPSSPTHHYQGLTPGSLDLPRQGRCDVSSSPPPPYHLNNAYVGGGPQLHSSGGPLIPLPQPSTSLSMIVGSSSSAFCAPQSQHLQQHQQTINPDPEHEEQHDENGYYQPAGPLISSHILSQPTNVPLLPTVGPPKIKHQKIPVALSSDSAHQHLQQHHVQQPRPPTGPSADNTDGHVLITGSDLTSFRYQSQDSSGNAPPPNQSPHHHQQQHQQQHQLHHQSSLYPRSMHSQMHYSTAYPPNYYIPYPGEPICYSTATAYQPYFSTKVYQNTAPPPPPPHHSAYRRYAYQTGPSQVTTHSSTDEHYEHQAPTTQSTGASSISNHSPTTLQQAASSHQINSIGPSHLSSGSQLVVAAHHHASSRLDQHYSPQSYYPNYNPGGGSPAGPCYTRSIQSPYMDYPQCPCPIQQSCPKNVHTGPHIGNNNNVICNSGITTATTNLGNNENNTVHNSFMPTTKHLTVNEGHNCTMNGANIASSNINSTIASSFNIYNLNATNHNDGTNCQNMISLNTNRGPVTNNKNNNIIDNNKIQQRVLDNETKQQLLQERCNAHNLLQEVKSEMKLEVSEPTVGKSQYEENVQPPPTPPESYGTIEDDDKDDRYTLSITQMREQQKTTLTPVKDIGLDRSMGPPPQIEIYDLTTAQEIPVSKKVISSAPVGGPAFIVVGRKARIGKTMAREMVYAGAANVSATSGTTAISQFGNHTNHKVCVARNPQTTSLPEVADSNTCNSQKMGPIIGSLTDSSELLVLKAKIKMENIKLEDDFQLLSQKQRPATANNQSHTSAMQIADHAVVKSMIKTEPNDLLKAANMKNSESVLVDQCDLNMSKSTWNSKKTILGSGVLDLCHSPLTADLNCSSNTKRMKILELSKSCKKSPPNSYKSLIKQAEPRTYLCLSRKIDKRGSRYRKMCKTHWRFNSGGNVRRRQLALTDQQKQRLRLRKKKLVDMERIRQEIHKKRRNGGRQKSRGEIDVESDNAKTKLLRTSEEKLKESKSQIINTVTINDIDSSEESIPLLPVDPPNCRYKSVVVSKNILQNNADVLGYYSDPETRSLGGVVTRLFRSFETKGPKRFTPTLLNGSERNYEKCYQNCTYNTEASCAHEKRSKSETKQPIKTSSEMRLLAIVPKARKIASIKNDENRFKTVQSRIVHSVSEEKLNASNVNVTKGQSVSFELSKTTTPKKTKASLCAQEDISSNSMESLPLHGGVKKIKFLKNVNSDLFETNNNKYDNIASVVTVAIDSEIIPSVPNALNDVPPTLLTVQLQPPSEMYAEKQQNKEQFQFEHSDHSVFLAPPQLPRIACHAHHYQLGGKRTRSRSKFGSRKKQKFKHSKVSFELDNTLPPAIRGDVIPKWNNGWMWEGEPFQGAVFLNSDDPLVIRTCYPAMRHSEGDIIRSRDCVLLKANEDNELPYVAKVAHLWENPEDGEMMMSLLWYYRPEHTEQGRQQNECPDEVYASRHRDHNSVACIEDKCYVLTFSEYCRYRRRLRAVEEEIEDVNIAPKSINCYTNARRIPPDTNPELVMFCRRAYEFRTKRLLKMPNKQDYYVVKS